MAITKKEIVELNERFRESEPQAVIDWALQYAKSPVVTTNFRPYEVAILNAVTQADMDIPVIWCDTGYNTPNAVFCSRILIFARQILPP